MKEVYPMLCLQEISWNAPDGSPVLQNLNLTVPEGKLMVITGPNGGGKTTLARIIAGIEQPASGRIVLDGEDITGMDVTQRARLGISFAFQQPVRFKGITVRQLLETAAGGSLEEKRLCDLLGSVGLCAKNYLDREVNATLSGGEMKRIEIATILARRTCLAVFDEPEAGIDLWSFSMLIKRFEEIHKEKKECLILISHQERIIQMADKIMVIEDGQVKEYGTKEDVLPTLFQQKTGRMCGQEGGTC